MGGTVQCNRHDVVCRPDIDAGGVRINRGKRIRRSTSRTVRHCTPPRMLPRQGRHTRAVPKRDHPAASPLTCAQATRRTALALNSSVNWRRGGRLAVSAIGLDLVSLTEKTSTEPDQAHAHIRRHIHAQGGAKRPADLARLSRKHSAIKREVCGRDSIGVVPRRVTSP
jgi:hypothetical protein